MGLPPFFRRAFDVADDLAEFPVILVQIIIMRRPADRIRINPTRRRLQLRRRVFFGFAQFRLQLRHAPWIVRLAGQRRLVHPGDDRVDRVGPVPSRQPNALGAGLLRCPARLRAARHFRRQKSRHFLRPQQGQSVAAVEIEMHMLVKRLLPAQPRRLLRLELPGRVA